MNISFNQILVNVHVTKACEENTRIGPICSIRRSGLHLSTDYLYSVTSDMNGKVSEDPVHAITGAVANLFAISLNCWTNHVTDSALGI